MAAQSNPSLPMISYYPVRSYSVRVELIQNKDGYFVVSLCINAYLWLTFFTFDVISEEIDICLDITKALSNLL